MGKNDSWLTSGEDLFSAEGLEVYPNPASGRLVFRCRGDEIKVIEIINPLGTRIARFDAREFANVSGSTIVDVGSIPDGTYLAVIKGRQTLYFSRFIKVSK